MDWKKYEPHANDKMRQDDHLNMINWIASNFTAYYDRMSESEMAFVVAEVVDYYIYTMIRVGFAPDGFKIVSMDQNDWEIRLHILGFSKESAKLLSEKILEEIRRKEFEAIELLINIEGGQE